MGRNKHYISLLLGASTNHLFGAGVAGFERVSGAGVTHSSALIGFNVCHGYSGAKEPWKRKKALVCAAYSKNKGRKRSAAAVQIGILLASQRSLWKSLAYVELLARALPLILECLLVFICATFCV